MPLKGLDKGQLAAATHNNGHALASAGPGSGKTKTSIAYVGQLLRNGATPRAIQILAFNTDAIDEFKSRLKASGAPGAENVSVRTLHSLGKQLASLLESNGHIPERALLDDDFKIQQFMRQALAQEGQTVWDVDDLQLDVLSQALSFAKGTMVRLDQNPPIEQLKVLAEGDELVAEAMVRFEELRTEAGFRTFDDLIYDPVRAILDDPKAWALVTNRFDYIVCDEYQDVDDAQQVMLVAITGTRGRMLAVGDEDQCIYTWRGANLFYMLREFEKQYAEAGVTRYNLDSTYRYGHELAIAANTLIRNNKERPDKTCISADSTPATRVEMRMAASQAQDDQWPKTVLAELDAWLAKGRKVEEVAVLVRTYSTAAPLELALLRSRTPYRLNGKGLLEMPEVRSMLAFASLTDSAHWQGLDREKRQASWELMLSQPGAFLPKALIRKVSDQLLEALPNDAAGIIREVAWGTGITPAQARGLSSRADVIERLAKGPDSPAAISRELWSQLPWVADVRRRVTDPVKQQERVDVLTLMKDEIAGYSKISEMLDAFVHRKVAKGSARLNIMSIHKSKGLEFPFVIIPGLVEGKLPFIHPERPTDLEAERRLLMVAMTRAQERLMLLAPSDLELAKRWQVAVDPAQSRQGDDAKEVTSRFLHEIDVESILAARTFFYQVGNHPITEGFKRYAAAAGKSLEQEVSLTQEAPAVKTVAEVAEIDVLPPPTQPAVAPKKAAPALNLDDLFSYGGATP